MYINGRSIKSRWKLFYTLERETTDEDNARKKHRYLRGQEKSMKRLKSKIVWMFDFEFGNWIWRNYYLRTSTPQRKGPTLVYTISTHPTLTHHYLIQVIGRLLCDIYIFLKENSIHVHKLFSIESHLSIIFFLHLSLTLVKKFSSIHIVRKLFFKYFVSLTSFVLFAGCFKRVCEFLLAKSITAT